MRPVLAENRRVGEGKAMLRASLVGLDAENSSGKERAA